MPFDSELLVNTRVTKIAKIIWVCSCMVVTWSDRVPAYFGNVLKAPVERLVFRSFLGRSMPKLAKTWPF